MKILADWYPGDGAFVATLELFGMMAIVILVTWVAERTLARRRAALASSFWLAALMGVLLTPPVVLLGPQLPWRVGVLAPGDGTAAHSAQVFGNEAETTIGPGRAAGAGAPLLSNEHASVPAHAMLPVPRPDPIEVPTAMKLAVTASPSLLGNNGRGAFTFMLGIWGLGGLWLTARLIHGEYRLHRLRRCMYPWRREMWRDELTEVLRQFPSGPIPDFQISEEVCSPLVAGLIRPYVVLPESLLARSTPEQLRDVLVHECAHVARRDLWISLLQQIAGALFWVHPLVHLLQRRLNETREEVCDNHVLAHASAPAYAGTLLSIAHLCHPKLNMKGHLAMLPRRHNLERRVIDLLDERRDTATRVPWPQRLAIVSAALLLLAGIASVGLHASAAQDRPSTQKTVKGAESDKKEDAENKPAGIGKIRGRVLNNADGSPAKGADVRLLKRGQYAGAPPTRKGATDERGEFHFEGLDVGAYRIWSLHGNLSSRTRQSETDIVEVAADGSAKFVTLKLQPGATARVTVLDLESGKPIAGAGIEFVHAFSDRNHLTDAKGQVELHALTPESWEIEATAKDRAVARRTLNLVANEVVSLELKLPMGGAVEGRVHDEKGKSLPGIGVSVFGTNDHEGQLRYVKTDADGRYRMEHLPVSGHLRFHLSDDNSKYLPLTRDFSIDPSKGRLARVDLEMKKRPHGGSIKGIVTDEKGQPIAGAELGNHGHSSQEIRKATTDAQGRFQLDDVYGNGAGPNPLPDPLVIKAKGFAPRRLSFKPGSADNPAEMTIPLEPGHRIKGRAVDEIGRPLADLRIYFAEGNRGTGMHFGGSTRSDAQGRFEFDSLPADTPFTFLTKDFVELANMKLALDVDTEVVVTLKSPALIKGRVVDKATRKHVPRFNVRINYSDDRKPDDPIAGGIRTARLNPGEDFTTTDGKFDLKDLLPGMPLQVSIMAPGYERYVARRVVALPGTEAVSLDFELTPEDSTRFVTVSGKLLNHKGQPVSGAELRLFAAKDRLPRRDAFPFNWQMIVTNQIEQMANVLQVHRTTTKADGHFQFDRIRGDVEVELAYWAKGIPAGRVDRVEKAAIANRADLLINALAPARVSGTIDRGVFSEFSEIQLSGSLRDGRAKVAADGKTFDIEDLPPGEYEIQIYGPLIRNAANDNFFQSRVIGRRSLTLREGAEAQVNLGVGDKVLEKN